MTRQSLPCRQCGAQLEYQPAEGSVKCRHCGSVTEIPQSSRPLPETPDRIIPLKLDREALLNAVQTYMASGEFTPDDLLDQAQVTTLAFHYVPAYVYSGEYEAEWTASFGYAREEHYTEYEEVTHSSDGRSWTERVPRTRTRTVYDWRPAHGRDRGRFALLGYAGPQAPSFAELLRDKEDLTGLRRFDPSYLAGIDAATFAASGESVYAASVQGTINGLIDTSVKQHAQGDRQQDWHWTADVNHRTESALVPLGHAVFEYRDKTYQFWVDGEDPARFKADPLPVDESRRPAINRGFLPALVAALAIPVAGIALGDEWLDGFSVSASIGFGAALLYAFLRKSGIHEHSRALREAALIRKRGDRANTSYLSDADRAALARSYARPETPLLARTSADPVLLPLLTVLAAASVALPLILDRGLPDYGHAYESDPAQWREARPQAAETMPAAAPGTFPRELAALLPRPTPTQVELALTEALQMGDWATLERKGTIDYAIANYIAIGHVGPTPDARLDYVDIYVVRQLASFLGHGLVAIEHEYMIERIGCCVNPGAGVLLAVNGSTETVNAFALTNGCTVRDPVDVSDRYGSAIGVIPRGHYALLSCRDNDALAMLAAGASRTAPVVPPSTSAAPAAAGGPCLDSASCAVAMLRAASNWNAEGANAAARVVDQLPKPERGDRQRARTLNEEGLRAFRTGDYALASSRFAEANVADPGDEEVLNNLIFSLSEDGKHAAAERLLAEAVLLNPRRANLWANMAAPKLKLAKRDEALGALWLAHEFSADRARFAALIERLKVEHKDPDMRVLYGLAADRMGLQPVPEARTQTNAASGPSVAPARMPEIRRATPAIPGLRDRIEP
ncbi:MAG TPA: hypothetical protein PKZ27_06710 [Rhodocyclaceae bacterium]|nr:hypothetical protein [Rhodocyclaceae bacterium]